jgi:hypothetical protein
MREAASQADDASCIEYHTVHIAQTQPCPLTTTEWPELKQERRFLYRYVGRTDPRFSALGRKHTSELSLVLTIDLRGQQCLMCVATLNLPGTRGQISYASCKVIVLPKRRIHVYAVLVELLDTTSAPPTISIASDMV